MAVLEWNAKKLRVDKNLAEYLGTVVTVPLHYCAITPTLLSDCESVTESTSESIIYHSAQSSSRDVMRYECLASQ